MIKIGIVGTGIVAAEHAKAIASFPDVARLVAAADLNAERIGAFAKAFGLTKTYTDAAALISDPDVQLVVITTPPAAHEALTVAALEAGKYVFCEKPLAQSLASAARIAAAAARHPGRLGVSYQFRYDAPFRRLSWLIQNGWIGKPEAATLERHSYIPHSNPGSGSWWGAWDVAGGGVLITQLIHELDMLILLMGKPVSVEAVADTRFTSIESEDYVQATIRFEGGGVARCVASVNSGYLGGGLVIKGSQGTADMAGNVQTVESDRAQKAQAALNAALPDTVPPSSSLVSRILGKVLKRPNAPRPSHYARFYREIAGAIQKGGALPIPAAEAITSLDLCMAIYESAVQGTPVTLPLSPESTVYQGVTRQAYQARKSSTYRQRAAQDGYVAMRAPVARPTGFSIAGLKRFVKWVLEILRLDPATLRALLRKPGPVHGGPKTRRFPWPVRKHFDGRERRAANRVLKREARKGGAVIYQGPEEDTYCRAFADYMGGGYADAVNSGTNAIYIALRALDLPPGSEVIVPPTSDAGGVMPVVMNMLVPVAADSMPNSINSSVDHIRKMITPRTSAILVTHMAGHPVDMDPIMDLAAEHGIPVVEDCAQSHGALYKGRMVGTFGAIAAYSTMFGKHHATGEQGGVVFTRDATLYAKARQIADRGKMFDPSGRMFNVVATLNFNQGEIAMAIGQVQLAKLPGAVRHRRAFAAKVAEGLRGLPGINLAGDPAHSESSYYYLMVYLDRAKIGCDSATFAKALHLEGLDGIHAGYSVYPTDQLWHQQGMVFGKSGLPWSLHQGKPGRYELPNAHAANNAMVRVEIHESLGDREARDLVTAITKVARFHAI